MDVLHHEIVAAPGAGPRPERTLIVLHGIFGHGRKWKSVAARLVRDRPDWAVALVESFGGTDDRPAGRRRRRSRRAPATCNGGHWLHIDNPDALHRLLVRRLPGNRRRPSHEAFGPRRPTELNGPSDPAGTRRRAGRAAPGRGLPQWKIWNPKLNDRGYPRKISASSALWLSLPLALSASSR